MDEEKSDKKVHYVPFIGPIKAYVGRSPWDFYSWGHIDMGIASWLLLSLIITIFQNYAGPNTAILPWWSLMVFVLSFGVLWEILENTIFFYWGWRPGGIDSVQNSVWDIIFVVLGGAFMWLLKYIIMDLLGIRGTIFYLVGIGFFLLVLIAYFIGYFLTNEHTKQARKERKSIS
ncbi:MAG: hypothetical protein P8Y97_21895 [Candidatus Lokiarchaeota archaeon]